MTNQTFLHFMASLPLVDGYPALSEVTPFQHDELAYDRQYEHDPQELRPGAGLVEVLKSNHCDLNGPCLEIGCGTGFLSLGLAAKSPFPLLVLSDPSTTFLRLTQKKIKNSGIPDHSLRYLILKGEDVDRLPAEAFSCIALRSTLHHIVDVPLFTAQVAKALRPGGVFIHQEPYAEGYLLMGSLVQFLPALAAAGGTPLTESQLGIVKICTDAMVYYYRTDIPKNGEDKHVFRVDELLRTCDLKRLDGTFFANCAEFEHFALPGARSEPLSFLCAPGWKVICVSD